MTTALYPVTMSQDPELTASFYAELLGLKRTFSADWYVSLAAPGGGPEFATVRRGHPSIPAGYSTHPGGVLITVEVESADAARERATALGARIELELRDEEWGQRHFIASDPDGALVDVIQPIAPSGAFAAQYTDAARPKGTDASHEANRTVQAEVEPGGAYPTTADQVPSDVVCRKRIALRDASGVPSRDDQRVGRGGS